jgi:hypothetical protein
LGWCREAYEGKDQKEFFHRSHFFEKAETGVLPLLPKVQEQARTCISWHQLTPELLEIGEPSCVAEFFLLNLIQIMANWRWQSYLRPRLGAQHKGDSYDKAFLA